MREPVTMISCGELAGAPFAFVLGTSAAGAGAVVTGVVGTAFESDGLGGGVCASCANAGAAIMPAPTKRVVVSKR
jgi:hypothetical protein